MRRHSRPHITAAGVIKTAIALGPVTVLSYKIGKANGWDVGVSNFVAAYTGYDFASQSFQSGKLVQGYAPLFGSIIAGKLLNRVGFLRNLRI